MIVVDPLAPRTETSFSLVVSYPYNFSLLGNSPLPFLTHLDYFFLYRWNRVIEEHPTINRYDHLDTMREEWENLSRSQQALFRKVSDLDRKRYVKEMREKNPHWDPTEASRYHGTFLKKGVYRSPLFYYLWTQFYSHLSELSENEDVNAKLVSFFEHWNELSEKKKQPYIHMSILYANEYSKEELQKGEICMSSFPIYPTAATYYYSLLNEYRSLKEPDERQIMEVLRSEFSKLSAKEQLPFVTILNEVKEKRREALKAHEGK